MNKQLADLIGERSMMIHLIHKQNEILDALEEEEHEDTLAIKEEYRQFEGIVQEYDTLMRLLRVEYDRREEWHPTWNPGSYLVQELTCRAYDPKPPVRFILTEPALPTL